MISNIPLHVFLLSYALMAIGCLPLVLVSSWTPPITHTRVKVQSSSSSPSALHMSTAPDLTGKILCRRIRHKLSTWSDVSVPDALSIEERIWFSPDSDQPGQLRPVGPRTLVLRNGNDKDSSWSYTLDVHNQHSTHNGFDRDLQSTIVLILYLASNPRLLQGDVLEIQCGLGLGALLGTIALAGVNGKLSSEEDRRDVDALNPIPTGIALPSAVTSLLLTDPDGEMLNCAVKNIQQSGISASKVTVDRLDWKHRPRILDSQRYRTIVASDVSLSYPTAKELARTVAYMLSPMIGNFVYVSPNDERDNVAQLKRLLEKGYLMSATISHDIELRSSEYTYQVLDSPEDLMELDDEKPANVRKTSFETVVAYHHPDYDGLNGEYFFPMATGLYDA